jgi:taurine dioxygenase
MGIEVDASGASCGALITGVDLSRELSAADISAIREAWLLHQVIAFPGQVMSIPDLERFASCLGPDGEDPYILPIKGHPRVIEVRREAGEKSPIFAETWHSDWSFLDPPPAGTLLYGTVIPPAGGDTLFANQYVAYDALPAAMKSQLAGHQGIHSARRGYARNGMYGENDKGRSMTIKHGDSAMKTQLQPIFRTHPETGRTALFVSPGYTIGIDGMPDAEAAPILMELFQHQVRPEFVYRHRWSQGMLTLWDNRCLLHSATGGYQGHQRLLHRITIAERVAVLQ